MKSKTKITVFGATGKTGTIVLRHLQQARLPVVAVTRNRDKAVPALLTEWVEADMINKESLYPCMADSKVVFLSSGMSEDIVQAQRNVIDAAREQGVMHLVKLSSGAADEHSSFPIAKAHGEIEVALKASGVPYTILRPNGFMQNWLGELAQTVRQERKIYEATGRGKRAYIDMRDIAEVAYSILATPEPHAGRTYLLTGGAAIDYGQVASAISSAIAEEVTYVPVDTLTARKKMEQKGLPQWAIETFLAYAEEQRNGHTAFVSNDVAELLQKPPRSLEAFVQEHAASFR